MKASLIYKILSVVFCFITINLLAQESTADLVKRAERTQQSVYIVMAVTATIFAGIFVYLFLLDRKISKLEKNN
jgi:CcmD family protein